MWVDIPLKYSLITYLIDKYLVKLICGLLKKMAYRNRLLQEYVSQNIFQYLFRKWSWSNFIWKYRLIIVVSCFFCGLFIITLIIVNLIPLYLSRKDVNNININNSMLFNTLSLVNIGWSFQIQFVFTWSMKLI
jgi:hypothetical protein